MDWNLAEVESLAKAKLSQLAFDYAQGGAGAERTLAENVAAFGRYRFRPRYLVDVSRRDAGVTLLGRRHEVPYGVAPTAFHKLFHPDGEPGVARACASRRVLHCVSTLSTTTLEDVAAAGNSALGEPLHGVPPDPLPKHPRWFQLYVHKDRALTRELVERAEAAGYEALVLTVDAPVWAIRHRDRRNKFTLPPPLVLANFEKHLDVAGGGMDGLQAYVNRQFDPSLTWADVDWLRDITDLPVLVKGILTPEDAALAVQHGCAGIVVSNHGGRTLDHVPATLDALPPIVEAVGGRIPLVLDGGVRGGADVLIALALGANFVLLGRQIVWGLAANGEAGVARVLDLVREELDNAMALTGVTRADAVARSLVARHHA